jgi:hypothetical protein
MGRATELADRWRETFFDSLRDPTLGNPLSTAALNENLQEWTTHLTTAVVRSCETLGWRAAAKGYPGLVLPVSRKEYLSLDVMAFEPSTSRWPLPVAVFELENKQRGEWVGYSLWKVLCVRASFRVVFAYRGDASEGPSLVAGLTEEVIASLSTEQRLAITGETLLVVGNRGEAETFPYGYFRGWRLEKNTGKFERV